MGAAHSGSDGAEPSKKTHLEGTHRVCPPEETLRRLRPLLGYLGVTRVADVTWLDDTGVPVYQAVRPNSYLLSVAQGKGLTPALAEVSAVMEAIELWHAERLGPGEHTATVGEVEGELEYAVDELAGLRSRNHLNPAVRLGWSSARHLVSGGPSLIPAQYLRLDGRVRDVWAPQLFLASSNGLASGNTFDEAVLHGLYETIERDSLVRTGPGPAPRVLDLDSVEGSARQLIEQVAGRGVQVVIEVLESPLGLPCLRARITSEPFPELFLGMGAHLDRDVALCRALTEAVQSRVTTIAGSRDDMSAEAYHRAAAVRAGRTAAPDLESMFNLAERVSYRDLPTLCQPTLADDLGLVAAQVHRSTGRDPLVVDHTRADVGIPVVRVVCPRLLFDADLV
ncbi:YcaO-like family protein [Streptantibioticus rubrisoli]|uniref:YcaO-like family protein n=1 Tax=Streptantibioticus rubrisoli TaxID=1387313 RepID=A0ABT1PEX0_9ACTN|nr:YcaO-like family protein [Streptantibioticus rubrisoli]MCQ4042778.1 YcaO-like family protein [Streptantibioticus rubrisoli]